MAENPPDSSGRERDGKRRASGGALLGPMVFVTAGIEMAATVGLLALGGWWLDNKLGTSPWLLLAGLFIGTIGSIYNLWKQGRRQFRQPPRRNK